MDLDEAREVTFQEADDYARNNGLPYMECSAKSGESVCEVFETLGKLIKERVIDQKIKPDDPEPDPIRVGRTIRLMALGKNIQSRCCEK